MSSATIGYKTRLRRLSEEGESGNTHDGDEGTGQLGGAGVVLDGWWGWNRWGGGVNCWWWDASSGWGWGASVSTWALWCRGLLRAAVSTGADWGSAVGVGDWRSNRGGLRARSSGLWLWIDSGLWLRVDGLWLWLRVDRGLWLWGWLWVWLWGWLNLGRGGAWGGLWLWDWLRGLGSVWAVGNLRSARGDGDNLGLVDDLLGHGHDHGAEENSGSGNGGELHFDCCFWWWGFLEKEGIKQIKLKDSDVLV